jgi:hypothetical protein
VLNFLPQWFLADARRICVLGVWLHLAGIAVLFLSFVGGMAPLGLVAGLLLAACGGWAKEAGREHFRRHRLRRVQSASTAEPSPLGHPAD